MKLSVALCDHGLSLQIPYFFITRNCSIPIGRSGSVEHSNIPYEQGEMTNNPTILSIRSYACTYHARTQIWLQHQKRCSVHKTTKHLPKGGRPENLKPKQKRYIHQIVRRNRQSWKTLIAGLPSEASKTTIKRSLKQYSRG